MKLLVAVVQDQDAGTLMNRLIERGFGATKLASTGGFLREGNTTLLVGVDDSRVQAALDCIREVCHHRRQSIPAGSAQARGLGGLLARGGVVEVGAATVFVLAVDRFERV
ncbi:MAG: cyclic-di-AMP receptor [Bacillota bacterium]